MNSQNSLKTSIIENIKNGLGRRLMDSCSAHAVKTRIMGNPFPGPWRFKYHPWSKEMHDADDDLCIGQKSAQAAYTETLLNRTFYKIDIRKIDVLYILPAKNPDAGDFSASRFDPALELSNYLKNLFSDVKNVGHKRSGAVNLYIRGSRSRSGLKSVPAGSIHFDEVDEMDQDNIPLAFERQSGQVEKQIWMISTPTIDDYGINKYFKNSSQDHFYFKCPSCGKQTELIFPECLVITSDDPGDQKLKDTHLICKECKNKLKHEEKFIWLSEGQWHSTKSGTSARGFHVNQLYSSTVEPWQLAQSFLLSQTSSSHEQEFYNSKLGLPHIVEGAKVSDIEITNAIQNYKNGAKGDYVTMGIDVGKWLHYVVTEWQLPSVLKTPDINFEAKGKVIEIGKVLHFEELDAIMNKHRPRTTVIDANPEKRKAYEFAQRFWGYIYLCYYGNNVKGKQINKTAENLEQFITVDRTSWLDCSLGRFFNNTIQLPLDTPHEFKENIKALVRKPDFDKTGNPIARYINTKSDHFGHANNYSEIALFLSQGLMASSNIRSPR